MKYFKRSGVPFQDEPQTIQTIRSKICIRSPTTRRDGDETRIPQSNWENRRGFSLSLKARAVILCSTSRDSQRKETWSDKLLTLAASDIFYLMALPLQSESERVHDFCHWKSRGQSDLLIAIIILTVKYVGAFNLIISVHSQIQGPERPSRRARAQFFLKSFV